MNRQFVNWHCRISLEPCHATESRKPISIWKSDERMPFHRDQTRLGDETFLDNTSRIPIARSHLQNTLTQWIEWGCEIEIFKKKNFLQFFIHYVSSTTLHNTCHYSAYRVIIRETDNRVRKRAQMPSSIEQKHRLTSRQPNTHPHTNKLDDVMSSPSMISISGFGIASKSKQQYS